MFLWPPLLNALLTISTASKVVKVFNRGHPIAGQHFPKMAHQDLIENAAVDPHFGLENVSRGQPNRKTSIRN